VLALDARSDFRAPAMDTLVTMAARLGVALEGVFVEDAELLRAAELPFVSEMGAAGHERTLTADTLRRTNRELSAELNRLMSALAGQRQVAWRYRVAEGNWLRTALHAGARCDLFIPPRQRRTSAPRNGPRPVAAMFNRVGFVYREPAQTPRIMSVLHALASNGHTREALVVCEGRPPAELLDRLAAEGLSTFVQVASLSQPAELLKLVCAQGPGLLIAPKDLLAQAGPLARALDALPMSVLLLR